MYTERKKERKKKRKEKYGRQSRCFLIELGLKKKGLKKDLKYYQGDQRSNAKDYRNIKDLFHTHTLSLFL